MRWSGAAGRRGGGRVCVLLRSGGGCWHRKESVLGRQRRLRQAANSAGESRLLLAGAQTPRSGACGRLARPPPMPRTPQRCLELQEDGTTWHNLPCQAGLGPCPTLPFQKGTLCFDSPPTPPRPGGRCCVFEAFFKVWAAGFSLLARAAGESRRTSHMFVAKLSHCCQGPAPSSLPTPLCPGQAWAPPLLAPRAPALRRGLAGPGRGPPGLCGSASPRARLGAEASAAR